MNKKENISNSSFKPVKKPIFCFKFSRRVMVLLFVAANRDFQFILAKNWIGEFRRCWFVSSSEATKDKRKTSGMDAPTTNECKRGRV